MTTATASVKKCFSTEPARTAAAHSLLHRERLSFIRKKGMTGLRDAGIAGIEEDEKER